jgi:ribulose-phosphate 3-epimerase
MRVGGEKAMKVLPALIAEDQRQLDKMLNRVKGFACHIMLDVMDGVFVSGRSLDFDYKLPNGPRYQAHLMVRDPLRYIGGLVGEADTAVIHVESVKDIPEVINVTVDHGLGTFLAINPDTPVDAVAPYILRLDGVLVMTVQPGRYGSPFLPWCLEKVEALRALDGELVIEVDGGMNPENAARAVEAGADMVAVGSYIVASEDPVKAYTRLVEAVHAAMLRNRGE